MSDANSTKTRDCNFPSCCKKRDSHGFCSSHARQYKSGKTLAPLRAKRPNGSPPVIEYDEVPCPVPGLVGPCHVWKHGKYSAGYGQVSLNGKPAPVHKYVWESIHGPVPDGLEIDHQCRVRPCCNVDHLRAVTHQINCTENIVGASWQIQAAKTHCKHGHPFNEENTYVVLPGGYRQCRSCRRRRIRAFKAAKKQRCSDTR